MRGVGGRVRQANIGCIGHGQKGGLGRSGVFVGGLEPGYLAGILFGVQGGGRGFAICFADGSDEVLASKRIQRLQPAEGHQHGCALRCVVRHHAGKDISMDARYDALCGITQEELEAYFAEPIATMAAKFGQTEEEVLQALKRRYDGYHFSEGMTDIYNPFSLLNTFDKGVMRDYWFSTGTPTYLLRLLSHSDENLNELAGKYYRSGMFMDYKATVEQPLPMIYQSGYLTIKDYSWEDDMFLLDFPNNEVKEGFLTMVASNYLKTKENASTFVLYLSKTLKSGDLEEFRKMLTSFLSSIPYSMRRKENEREKERYFHYTTFYLLLRLMSLYTVYTEKEQSEGRVDCIVETDKYVYIFEFKLDGMASEALAQIKAKGYARPYEADARKLFRIGAVFSSQTGTISDWAVE